MASKMSPDRWHKGSQYQSSLNGAGASETPRYYGRRYATALLLLLVPIAWVCSSSLMLIITPTEMLRDRHEKHHESILNRPLTLNEEFQNIVPSEKLQWHACYQSFQCARLTVPLDYNRPLNASHDNPKVHMAMMMLPGINSTLSGNYGTSPLLLNPGGPGGSGVQMVEFFGASIQQIVSTDQDIIGFDPRGVGHTTPQADCFSFPSNRKNGEVTQEDYEQGAFNRIMFLMSGQGIGVVNTSNTALSQHDERARVVASLCQSKDDIYGDNSIFRHLSTPAVAQDMLSIVDAWQLWREETGQTTTVSDILDDDEDDSNSSTEGKLVYWGFSYGSLLGATFASMFPDRVGRIILDGIVDADYYVEPIWADSLRDTDAAEASFFKFCTEAEELCPLYHDGDAEVDVKARFFSVMSKLKDESVIGINTHYNIPIIISYSIIKTIMFQCLYNPPLAFPAIAAFIDMIDRGNTSQVVTLANPFIYKPFCTAQYFSGDAEAQRAVMCSDKRYPLNESVSAINDRYDHLVNISHYADVWTTVMLGCNSWPIKATDPPMRWDRHPAHKQHPIRTSFPLLFLSNTADPVTPLYAGVKMAQKFIDAGLIEQQSEGHCSISSVSLCTMRRVKAYFTQGKVTKAPKWGKDGGLEGGEWETCERSEVPFKGPIMEQFRTLSAEEKTSVEAWRTLGKAAAEMAWFGREKPTPGQLETMGAVAESQVDLWRF